MHIVLIQEDLFQERKLVGRVLKAVFPEAQVTAFGGVGWFLEGYERLRKPFILIAEIVLPLFAVENSDDNLPRRVEKLKTQYPWLGDEWGRLHGGEVLIRGIRNVQSDLPIVVYTDVDYGQIPEDIKRMDRLKICEKGDTRNFPDLVRKIRSFGI